MKPLAKKLIAVGRTVGPYLALELVMPGGTLLAVLLWLYRMSRTRSSSFPVRPQAVTDEFQPPPRFYTRGWNLQPNGQENGDEFAAFVPCGAAA